MIDQKSTRDLIRLAINEDLAQGDVTSELTVAVDIQGTAEFLVKEECVVCGLPLLSLIIEESKAKLKVECFVEDGSKVGSGTIIASISGTLREILSLERIMLNFLQRLSGCATLTNKIVANTYGLKVLDTRKTTPGFRLLEKYAVLKGGGFNHRLDLSKMILVKDNHIDANGGDVKKTLQKVFEGKSESISVEVEVRNLAELRAVLEYTPDIIMLDNMDDSATKEAVGLIREKLPGCLIEVSGRVKPERFAQIAALGANTVSMGALTNSYSSVDISLDIKISRTTG